LLIAILHERQVELFTEWGHRWLDLKRTGNVNAVMSIVTPSKGGTWQATDQLFPIPQGDIDKNPNIIQNSGY
jgi:starch-binding outer membrane protein, SusD/RagB family